MKIKKVSQAIAVVGKVLNSKSTSTQDTYSCDYINNIVKWKSLGSTTGQEVITFSNDFNEILAMVKVDNNDGVFIPIIINKEELSTTNRGFNGGYYGTSSTNSRVRIMANTTSAYLGSADLNGNSSTNNTIVNWFYR